MQTNPGLLNDLNALVEPDARGDPMSPLRWTCKSLRRLAAELEKLGHKVSHTVVGELLKKQKFSLQANRKTREGADNPDRDRQFRVVNDAVKAAMAENQPAISVDTKKKELVGDFKNAGREWRLWKLELQRLADELGLSIEVHHLPPGTSKWNKIEHRLFSFITQNWRAR